MATILGMVSFNGSSWTQSWGFIKSKRRVWSCSYASSSSTKTSLIDQYRTLQIQPGASESEVKKAFRQLALQYHPDVCKGSNCGVQFHQINEAYDIVMSNLTGESNSTDLYNSCDDAAEDEPMRGMYDPDWDLWEEWMGWEGAGFRDYSSHINPYIKMASFQHQHHFILRKRRFYRARNWWKSPFKATKVVDLYIS